MPRENNPSTPLARRAAEQCPRGPPLAILKGESRRPGTVLVVTCVHVSLRLHHVAGRHETLAPPAASQRGLGLVIKRSLRERSHGAQYLLRVDLVVELQDVEDPVLDALQGQGGSVAVQAAWLCDPAWDLGHGQGTDGEHGMHERTLPGAIFHRAFRAPEKPPHLTGPVATRLRVAVRGVAEATAVRQNGRLLPSESSVRAPGRLGWSGAHRGAHVCWWHL